MPLGEILVGAAVALAPSGSRWPWIVASASFFVLLAFALRATVAGETDCGCFGKLSVRPFQTLLLDTGLFSASLIAGAFDRDWRLPTFDQLTRLLAVSLVVWFGMIAATFVLDFGGRYLPESQPLIVRNYPARVAAHPHAWFKTSLHVHNRSARDITVFGGTQSCGAKLDGTMLPLTLRPGETRLIHLHARTTLHASTIAIPLWVYVGNTVGIRQRMTYRATVFSDK